MKHHETPAVVPALERVTHLAGVWVERSCGELHVTQAEAHVLAYLTRHGPRSINDLHHHFGHRRSTLTSLLDRLERRGWVQRGQHPASRRMVMLHLTDAGQRVGHQISARLSGLEARLAARVARADLATCLHVIQMLEEELSHD
jgi:DNA-binding MarR family transcriptional regulator